MIQEKLTNFIKKHKCTLLGVGPMSVNCVDASIALANEHEIPIMLIASRNQIDSEEFGGGYVNNWTTEQFSQYVLDHDKKGHIILARDHGGPWQNKLERNNNLGLHLAMESSKRSFKTDIASGFQMIHIDPSIDLHSKPDIDEIIDRILELYVFCWKEASIQGKNIIFEIGTEEQCAGIDSFDDIQYSLQKMQKLCDRYKLPYPSFIVMQTGTKVVEMRNIGVLDSPFRVRNEIPAEIQIPRMLKLCQKYNIMLKQHNTDYLSDKILQRHPYLGIHAANVAPEFGVVETKALLNICRKNGLDSVAEDFLDLAYKSKKWEKWMLSDSSANKEERAIISGHYVFATPECVELKARAKQSLAKKGIDLDAYLIQAIKKSIEKYLYNFRLVMPS